MRLEPGMVTFADLGSMDPTGHGQAGSRPCIVVGNPAMVCAPRFRMVLVAPMTTAELPACSLYPRLAAGQGGLAREGTAMLDQVRAIDLRRLRFVIGRLEPEAYRPIADGLRAILQL